MKGSVYAVKPIVICVGHKIMFVLSAYTIFAMMMNVMMVVILLGVVPVKKNTAWIVSLINNVICAGGLFATNVNKQKCVRGWTVIFISVKIASRRGRATVAVLLGVGIVLYLMSVRTGTATKLFALAVFRMGIVGVASAIIVDWNFVPMTVDTTYRNAAKKMGRVFVLIVHLRVRVCIDGDMG